MLTAQTQIGVNCRLLTAIRVGNYATKPYTCDSCIKSPEKARTLAALVAPLLTCTISWTNLATIFVVPGALLLTGAFLNIHDVITPLFKPVILSNCNADSHGDQFLLETKNICILTERRCDGWPSMAQWWLLITVSYHQRACVIIYPLAFACPKVFNSTKIQVN